MPPSSPVAGSREQRRARIEAAALELFRSRGFDHVTVEDVCAEAGVGPATFYRHFGTKEGVVFAYREARSEEHTSELQSRQYLVCRLLLEKKKHLRPVHPISTASLLLSV